MNKKTDEQEIQNGMFATLEEELAQKKNFVKPASQKLGNMVDVTSGFVGSFSP